MDTSWILRLRLPLLPPQSDCDVTGGSGIGVHLPGSRAVSVSVLSELKAETEFGEVASSSPSFLAALSGV